MEFGVLGRQQRVSEAGVEKEEGCRYLAGRGGGGGGGAWWRAGTERGRKDRHSLIRSATKARRLLLAPLG